MRVKQTAKTEQATQKKRKSTLKQKNTTIVVKFNCGFSNTLFIRGEGMGLNWYKGIPLKNVKVDEWVWETDTPFQKAQFKILLNDREFESGENHTVECGTSMNISPRFS